MGWSMEEVDAVLEAATPEDAALAPRSDGSWQDGAWRRSTPPLALKDAALEADVVEAWRRLGARGACSSASDAKARGCGARRCRRPSAVLACSGHGGVMREDS